jgi:uncharacterized protein YgbK (DUF1537 family)
MLQHPPPATRRFQAVPNVNVLVWRHKVIQEISQILIVADDLSGAADCTAGAMRAGLDTRVTLRHALTQNAFVDSPQVWSIDADTRRLPPAVAVSVNTEILKQCRTRGQLLYKKIDSTLRGNFAAELKAMVECGGMAVVAPAFPDAGRSTRDGRQYVHGIKLEETEIWRHEGMSGAADLPAMLAAHGMRTALIPLARVRAGHATLREALHECLSQGKQAVVCDAQTNDDLERIAKASIELSPSIFWAGSAGLANQLPDAAGMVGCAHTAPRVDVRGPILCVVGSLSAVSHGQAAALLGARALKHVTIPTDVLGRGELHGDWDRYQRELGAALEGGHDTLLAISDAGQPDLRQGWQLCQALARLMSPFSLRLGGMISMGGETTHALLSAFGCAGLHMVREVQPGVPLSVTLGALDFPIITKAGAFGTADTLVRCYDALHRIRLASSLEANKQETIARAFQNQSD